MAVPNIDTFEHDIAEEIKHREAGFTDIATAGNDIGNETPKRPGSPRALVLLGTLFVALVLIFLGILVYYYNKTPTTQGIPATGSLTPEQNFPQGEVGTPLATISPALAQNIQGSVQSIARTPFGYAITLRDYRAAFSYMLKNEAKFGGELAQAVGSLSGTSTPVFVFNDVTLSNQNMRVGTSASSTVVYAFFRSTTLLIASSTQGILSMQSTLTK